MSEIKILSKKEIDALLTKPSSSKEVLYGSTIEKLKSGEGFLVNIESFKQIMKTPLQTYYANKYKKKDQSSFIFDCCFRHLFPLKAKNRIYESQPHSVIRIHLHYAIQLDFY